MNYHVGNETAGTQSVPNPVKEREGSPSPAPLPVPQDLAPTWAWLSRMVGKFGMEQVLTLGLAIRAMGAPPFQDQPCCPRLPPGATPGPTHSTPGDQL